MNAKVLSVSLGVFWLLGMIVGDVLTSYQYDRQIGSFWDLSVKASTLDKKADYLNQFVGAIDAARLDGYNAVFLTTPNNSIAQNLVALHSLQQRMDEIRRMKVTSFEYQQAIAQITAQEQDEATHLLSVIRGRWFLTYHPLFWGWLEALSILAALALIAVPTKNSIIYVVFGTASGQSI